MSATLADAPTCNESVRIPATVRDLDTFRDWIHSADFPDHVQASYLQGSIFIEMSPQEIESHAKLKMLLYGELWDLVKETDAGEILSDGTLLVNETADVSNEPDMMYVTWASLRDGTVEYRERREGSRRFVEVVGSPDLAVEVVSDSSVQKDTVELFDGYFNAGVTEYWLIDARGDEIDFRIHTRGADRFEPTPPDADGFTPSAVLSRRFRIERELNPVGMYRYRMEIRELSENGGKL